MGSKELSDQWPGRVARWKVESCERRVSKGLLLKDLGRPIFVHFWDRPMHGYQANAELERREVRDWAGVSRPQVYYSLEKLARLGLVRAAKSAEPAAGPERLVFATAAKGRRALADALAREDWMAQRDRPAFLTWLALSWQARPGVFSRQLKTAAEFLEKEAAREQEVLRSILEEAGHPYHEAVWMVSLVIEQFRLELRWLKRIERELPRRAQARYPRYARGGNGVRGACSKPAPLFSTAAQL